MKASAHERLIQFVDGRSRGSALRSALGGVTVAVSGMLAAASGSSATDNRCRKKLRKVRRKLRNQEPETCIPKALGEPCASATECCGTTTGLSCARRSENGETPVCCATAGMACSGDDDCCAGFFCPDNTCFVVDT